VARFDAVKQRLPQVNCVGRAQVRLISSRSVVMAKGIGRRRCCIARCFRALSDTWRNDIVTTGLLRRVIVIVPPALVRSP